MSTFNTPPSWLCQPVKIAVVGVGGTGSELLDELLQLHHVLNQLNHPGLHVTAYDPKTVGPFNIGRQRFASADVGFNKAHVLIHRYNMHWATNWNAVQTTFELRHINNYDLIITCVDKASARAQLAERFHDQHFNKSIYWLDCGNGNHDGQVVFGHGKQSEEDKKAGQLYLPNVCELYPVLHTMEDGVDSAPSCSHEDAIRKQDWGVNRLMARGAAGILWNLMRHGQINYHGCFINSQEGSTTPLEINPLVWRSFGWDGEQRTQ